jgi:hypothetical protein
MPERRPDDHAPPIDPAPGPVFNSLMGQAREEVAASPSPAREEERPAAPAAGPPSTREVLLALQRTAGNRTVARLVGGEHTGQSARALLRFRNRSRRPFERVLRLHKQAAETLDLLVRDVEAISNRTPPLDAKLKALRTERDEARSRSEGAARVVDLYVAGAEYDRPDIPVDALNYVLDDSPNQRGLRRTETLLQRQITLADVVRPRVLALAKHTISLGANPPEFITEAFHTVAGYYLDIVRVPGDPRAADRLAFLDSFYQDPGLIESWGILLEAGRQVPAMHQTLKQAAKGGVYLIGIPPLEGAKPFGRESFNLPRGDRLQARRAHHLMVAFNALLQLKQAAEAIGSLPRDPSDVRVQPSPEQASGFANLLLDAQVRVAVLTLWQPIDPLRTLIYSHDQIGTTFDPTDDKEDMPRARWLDDLRRLEEEYDQELNQGTHPGIAGRVEGWERRLNVMLDAVPRSARRWHIAKAIVEQIPFIFVAGATAMRVGAFVRGLTASRWLVALAEGATMTAFSAVGTRPGSPGRPSTALGWTGHLVMNVLWARVGRALFDVTGDVAGKLASTRLAFMQLGTRVVAPTVALTSLQTTAQLIEQRVRGQGGDTSFSELLTINLILNGMGLAVGLATMPPSAAAARNATELAAPRPSAAEVARQLGVSDDVARQMLEVAARIESFMAQLRTVQRQTGRGRLSPEQFESLRDEALKVADFLEPRLGAIARGGGLGGHTPDQVQAAMTTLRARLRGMTYEAKPSVTALLPQSVEGLTQVGEGPTWTYNQASPPRRLDALKASYAARGHTVKALPSGGWEAIDAQGALAAQVLPVAAAAAAALPKGLVQVAAGPLAQAGLARMRAQTAVPVNMLEARLVLAAGRPGGERAVQRILQQLGRFVEPGAAEQWDGIAKYLELGGDPVVLARGLAYGSSREFAAESRLLSNRLLGLMAGWDAEAVRGFEALYRIRSNLTAERLHNLVADFEPAQVRGIMQSLAVLESRSRGLRAVIGPLTSGSEPSMRGAMGALTTGVQLAERHPDAVLVFEDPVQDPGTGVVTRVTDISVRVQETTRVGGRIRTREVELVAVEVKEVSTRSLGARARQELARDIVRDHRLRSSRVAPSGGSRPLFETFIWRIRRNELQAEAMRRVGTSTPLDPRVDAEMRRMMQAELRGAFERKELDALPQAERDAYRRAFESDVPLPGGVPFIEFF